jgi:DNA-binding PadR family transcriptional regulator
MFMLVDQNIADTVGGPHFDFRPSRGAPFDRAVYETVKALEAEGLAESVPEFRWRSYRLTPAGQRRGEELLNDLPEWAREYIRDLPQLARELSLRRRLSSHEPARPDVVAHGVF